MRGRRLVVALLAALCTISQSGMSGLRGTARLGGIYHGIMGAGKGRCRTLQVGAAIWRGRMTLRGSCVVEVLRGGLDHDDETEQGGYSELQAGGGRRDENGQGDDGGAGGGQQQQGDDARAKDADSDELPGGGEVARAMASTIDGGAWNAEEEDEKVGQEWEDLIRQGILDLQLEQEENEPENEQEYRNQQVNLALPLRPTRRDDGSERQMMCDFDLLPRRQLRQPASSPPSALPLAHPSAFPTDPSPGMHESERRLAQPPRLCLA